MRQLTCYRCLHCHAVCTPNLDHVERCNGECSGTYEHPEPKCRRARENSAAGFDLGHSEVFASGVLP